MESCPKSTSYVTRKSLPGFRSRLIKQETYSLTCSWSWGDYTYCLLSALSCSSFSCLITLYSPSQYKRFLLHLRKRGCKVCNYFPARLRVVARVQIKITLVANKAATRNMDSKTEITYFSKTITGHQPVVKRTTSFEFDEAIGSANLTGAGKAS